MSLVVLGVVLPWLAVGFLCWLGYLLVRQYGHLLTRLEAIEEQLQRVAPPTPAPAIADGLPAGSPAPPFELPDIDGQNRSFDEFRGRRILLTFWDPACGFCRQMAPDLAAVTNDGINGRPLPVLVSSGDVESNRALLEEHGIQCPVLLQEQREVMATYKARGTPMGYVIDERGYIASELMAGAPSLLALAEPSSQVAEQNGQKGTRTFQSVEFSRINREGLPPGTQAPNFRLPRLDGGELSLEEYRGRRVLLVFSDPDCGPCNLLAPQLEDLHNRTADLEIVMISRGDRDANRAKAAVLGLTFPIVLQRKWEISRDYGMFATPIGFLINEQGVIARPVASGAEGILELASAAVERETVS